MDKIPPNLTEANGQIFRRNGVTNEDDADDEDCGQHKGLLGRRRKGAHEYATQYQDDFICQTIPQHGRRIGTLVCRFCSVMIGTRSDRIKEHLSSKRHMKLKSEWDKVAHGQYSTSGDGNNQQSSGQMASSTYIPPRPQEPLSDKSASQGFGAIREDDISINLSMPMEHVNVLWPSTSAALHNMASMGGNVNDNSNLNVDKRWMTNNGNTLPDQLMASEGPSSSQSKQMSYKLTWNGQGNIFRNAFIMFQEAELLTDVKLSSGTNYIKCHKVVLSACSEYFTSIFNQHPPLSDIIIVLKPGIISELKALVHFMYHGELTVAKDGLKPLLKLAKELGITGLIQPDKVGNKQAETIDIGKTNKSDSRNVELSTHKRWTDVAASGGTSVNAKEGCVPDLFPIGSSFSARGMPGQGPRNNATTNVKAGFNGTNGEGPVITSTSSLSASSSLLNGSGSSSLPGNITLVNDRASMMMPGMDAGNYMPLPVLPPRKRKFQPNWPVTLEMIRCKKSKMVMPDVIEPSSYCNQLPLPSILTMNMAGGFQPPSNGNIGLGNGIISSPPACRNTEGLNTAAGQIGNGDGGQPAPASNGDNNPTSLSNPAGNAKAKTTVVFGQRGQQYFMIGTNSNSNDDGAGNGGNTSSRGGNLSSFAGGM